MSEQFPTPEQLTVLEENLVIAKDSGMLDAYTLYQRLRTDSVLAFKAAGVFEGLSVVIGQINQRSGHSQRTTFTPLGFITADFEARPYRFFSDQQLLLAAQRLEAELAVGLPYVPDRKRNFLDDWVWSQS